MIPVINCCRITKASLVSWWRRAIPGGCGTSFDSHDQYSVMRTAIVRPTTLYHPVLLILSLGRISIVRNWKRVVCLIPEWSVWDEVRKQGWLGDVFRSLAPLACFPWQESGSSGHLPVLGHESSSASWQHQKVYCESVRLRIAFFRFHQDQHTTNLEAVDIFRHRSWPQKMAPTRSRRSSTLVRLVPNRSASSVTSDRRRSSAQEEWRPCKPDLRPYKICPKREEEPEGG